MADAGAVGRFVGFTQFVATPWYALSPTRPAIGAIPINGAISGTVTSGGVPMSRATVRLYYRQTGALVTSAFSASDGGYAFYGLEPGAAYMVVAVFDRLSTQGRNAIVYDEVLAV